MNAIFTAMGEFDHEQIAFCQDQTTGLKAIVAIHSTVLGPALGGTRFKAYPDENAALEDVLRLARGMTYKAAVAGLDLGGGKAVIIGDPATTRSEALFRAYGRFVDGLGGRYITAEDVGTTQADMDLVRRETRYVVGIDPADGGSGDPSPTTAFGVYNAMLAVCEYLGGERSIAGKHVAVSGIGKVGGSLVQHLVTNDAKVTVADVNADAVSALVADLGVASVSPEDLHKVPCDIYSPCALGATLNPQTLTELQCKAVVGAANNQLATPDIGYKLQEMGILYAPDFVVNAGGLIHVSDEFHGFNASRVIAKARRIGDTTLEVLRKADELGVPTSVAADKVAEERITQLASINRIRRGEGHGFASPTAGRHPTGEL